MPPEFTPLTELEPDSWHRRTHPNPVAQALAHSSPFRLPFRSIRRSDAAVHHLFLHLRDGLGHSVTIPPSPGREPWNRQYAEPQGENPAPLPLSPAQPSPLPRFFALPYYIPELAQSLVGLLQSRPGEHGLVVSKNANLVNRLCPYISKLLPDCTICISEQTISLPDGSQIHFYQPHRFYLARGLTAAWLVTAGSVSDQDLRRFVLCVRSHKYVPTFHRFSGI